MAKKQITCPNCGAQIEPTQLLRVECPYCGSTFHNPLDREDKGREVIRKIVPFKISEKQVTETLFYEFINKKTVPQDIFDKLSILSIEQFYLPMYIFSGRFNADWSCTVVYSHTDRQGNTHEEYRPANGTATGNFAKLALAHNGQNLSNGIQRFVNVMSLTPEIHSNIKPFDPAYLVGERGETTKVVESNITVDDCWNGQFLQGFIEYDAYNAAQAQTSGWRTQDFSVSSNWGYNYSDLVLMPLWYVRYTYDGQEYYFVMGGHDGRYDYTYPQDNTSVNRTWKIVARFFIMVFLLGIILFSIKDSIPVKQAAVAFFGASFLTVSFILEYSKSSKELSSIKQIGKARFCNEPTPNVPFNYVHYKRANQVMMWLLIGVVAVWSYFTSVS